MPRKTLKHVRRLAQLAELCTAETLAQAEAFICGWTQGRNREIIK